MLIGIISDTHDRLSAATKACSIFKEQNITTLLHAGDFIAPFVIPLFKDFNVYGTFGNNDGEKKGLLAQFSTIHAVVTDYFCEVYLDSLAIAVTHGHIPSLLNLLVASSYDLVVTGHTHYPQITREAGSPVVINPGECCGYLTDTSTVAVFDTETQKGEIIEVI
jgi:putative phosphoesterase